MKSTLAAVCFTISSFASFSQSFRGSIRDLVTKEALPYASIGIRQKGIGTITDLDGRFKFDVSQASNQDTLVISYIGYSSLLLPISKLDVKQENTFELKPTPKLLKEVVISAKPETIILGNKSKSSRYTGWGDFKSSRGRAIGLLIKSPAFPVRVNKLFFHVDCEFDSARVRINLFKMNGKKLEPFASQKQNIFFTIHKRRGWIEVGLNETIVLRHEEVIVAIEWVDAWAKPRAIEQGGSYLFTLSLAHSLGYHYIRKTPEESIRLTSSEFTPSIYLECFAIRD